MQYYSSQQVNQDSRVFHRLSNGATPPESNSPLLGDALALSYPGVLEVIAKLVPKHKNVIRDHFFLPGLWLSPKVAHRVLETAGENRTEAQTLINYLGHK